MTPERQRLLRQVEQALADSGGLLTLDDLTAMARERKVQIWTRGDSLCATEIIDHPRRRVMNCIVAAGRLAEVLALEADIEAFAREHGATAMVTHGRPAWGRIGERTGWRMHSVRFVKPLLRHNGGAA